MADLNDLQAAQSVKIVGTDSSGLETNAVNVTANGLKTDGSAVTQPVSGTVTASVGIGDNYTPSSPYTEVSVGKLMTDPDNQLLIRGDILTDEGQFRDDFVGATLDTATWTASNSGTGSSITVSNSFVNVNAGTANNGFAQIVGVGDYGPISFRSQFSFPVRQSSQTIDIGMADLPTGGSFLAVFRFTGATNTTVSCITSSSTAAADTQTTTTTIPAGTSATSNDYYIEIQPDQVTFIINGIIVAKHKLHIPGPYDVVNPFVRALNTAGGSSSNAIAIDYIYIINQNSIQVNNSFTGDDLIVKHRVGAEATYSIATNGLVPAAAATDVLTITGSATKTVKVTRILFSATQSTAASNNILILKRSTANTAGTSTAPTKVPHDSLSAAATATVLAYTANPTVGTLVGNISSAKVFIPSGTSTTVPTIWTQLWGQTEQAIILRGTSEVLAVNLSGITMTSGSLNIAITWTEE